MLTVTGLWFDHERAPVGLDHTPVFGWQLEGNCPSPLIKDIVG